MDDKNPKNEINEPQGQYEPSDKKKITFFNSFEEAKDYGRKEMADHTPLQRMQNLEILRKRIFRHLLSPDGTWPPQKKIIIIEKGTLL